MHFKCTYAFSFCFSVHAYYPSPPATSRKFPHCTHSFPERPDDKDDKITNKKILGKRKIRFMRMSLVGLLALTDHENTGVGGERKERERASGRFWL